MKYIKFLEFVHSEYKYVKIICARRQFATGRFRNQSKQTFEILFSKICFDKGIA